MFVIVFSVFVSLRRDGRCRIRDNYCSGRHCDLAMKPGGLDDRVAGLQPGDQDGVFQVAAMADVALRAKEALDAVNVEALARGRQGVGFGAFGGFYGECFCCHANKA